MYLFNLSKHFYLIFWITISLAGFHVSFLYGNGNTETNDLPVKVGLLPDTQGSGGSVSIYPMEAALDKLQEEGVQIVIPVGDLTNHGTAFEFDQWTNVAREYKNKGVEFLPLMGNHETSYAYAVEWIEYMKEFIPEDAVHMRGAEYSNYYVVRGNVLIIALRYGNLPIAFEWIKGAINEQAETADHIIIASHDSVMGRARSLIGTEGTVSLWDEIRAFFYENDVIWVYGHEHRYQRSVIEAPFWVEPKSWVPADGNYRLPQFTQILSGNASYKGYEARVGEYEKVQRVIQHKMNTFQNGSEGFDVNASVFTFDQDRVEYKSYFTTHTIKSNDEGRKELVNPEWTLMDQFMRTTNRCERLVYPNSIPGSTRSALYFDPHYRTNDCYASDGSKARLVDGINDTFNRVESTPGTFGDPDLMRIGYQYLFQLNEPWSPNLNGDQRLVVSDDGQQVEIPATTIDLKEHLTLSWSPASDETQSDRLIISGTQVHTGMYSSAYGAQKDIERDTGLERSQPDGSAKQPHKLPESASKSWDLKQAVADQYVLQFDGAEADPDKITLGFYEQGRWQPFTQNECMINAAYNSEALDNLLSSRSTACSGEPAVGYDRDHGNRWWVVLESDIEVALIEN